MTVRAEGTGGGTDDVGGAPLPPCYTPQQVRFTDRRGVLWTVRCARRLAEPAPSAAPGRATLPLHEDAVLAAALAAAPSIDDERVRIAACRAGRCWLEFSSATERRRLRLVPPRWYTLSPAALALLCEEAEVEGEV